MTMIEQYLEALENRIDPDVEDALQAEWEAFTSGRFHGAIFSPKRPAPCWPMMPPWPTVSVNRAQTDSDAMLLQQYGACADRLARGDGALMAVRANYGTGILPSLFGAELFVMDASHNTLQTSVPLGAQAMGELVSRGIPDLNTGLGATVFETGKRFAEIAARYPRIGKYVHIYHPDLQGPMDACEMLWGSRMFLDVIDAPERVHQVLDVLTDTYVEFIRRWDETIDAGRRPWAVHWGMMHGGKIMIRTDSGMNLSPEMYDAFIRPYDQRLFKALGGGAVHFCGRGSHYIASTCAMDGLNAINLSQPHLNDMETIYRNTIDQGIKLLGFSRETAEKARAAGREFHGCVHCW